MQAKKSFWHSRTLRTNVIGIVVIIVSTVLANEEIAQEIMTAEASILAVINLILRIVTNQGLSK